MKYTEMIIFLGVTVFILIFVVVLSIYVLVKKKRIVHAVLLILFILPIYRI
jgi:hypothetical protein